MGIVFQTVPVGSLQLLGSEARLPYIIKSLELPPHVQDMVYSAKIGAYITGLTKSYNLPLESGPRIARIVFFIAIGDRNLAQLPVVLSAELKIANDKAQQIAQEIERDIFAPIALELNQYLSQKKSKTGSMAEKLGIQGQQRPMQPPDVKPNPYRPPAPPSGPSKFPRRPAAPPNILNLKDKQNPPQPPFIA